jgi:hypothetical protein
MKLRESILFIHRGIVIVVDVAAELLRIIVATEIQKRIISCVDGNQQVLTCALFVMWMAHVIIYKYVTNGLCLYRFTTTVFDFLGLRHALRQNRTALQP